MPAASVAITRFNAGKLSPQMGARIDDSIRSYYDAGGQEMSNFVSLVEGPMLKRSGFKFVKEVRKTATNVRLIPYQVDLENAFMLEFTNAGASSRYMRVMKNDAAVLEASISISGSPTAASPVSVTTSGAHSLTTGDEVFVTGSGMDELNGRYFTVTVTGATTFTLDGEDGSARTTGTGGTIAKTYEITSFAAVDLGKLKYAQRAFDLFVTSPEQLVKKVTRSTDTSWAISDVAVDADNWPAFQYDDTSGTTMQASAVTGTGITITASTSFFTAAHVGRYIRLTDTTGSGIGPVADSGGEGYVLITAVTSPPSATCTATVVAELDPQVVSSPTTRWALDAFNSTNGYPTAITFFDDRLWLSGVANLPGEFWASRIGSYEDFSRLSTDAGGLHGDLQQGSVNNAIWMAGLDEVLIVGTDAGEHTITSLDSTSAVAAGNVKARRRSQHGSRADVSPVVIDARVVFSQRAGRKVRDFRYQIESNELTSTDLTRLSREITIGSIAELAYQQEPNRVLWARLSDGGMVALTHEYNEVVTAWSDVAIGGSGSALSVATLPSDSSSSDEVWAVFSRTINGGTHWYIETLDPFWERPRAVSDAVFVDSAIVYSGSATTEFTGAHHLEGETVQVLADGQVVDDVTISDGSFSLVTPASKVVIGYAYVARYLSMPVEGGSRDGVSQGKPGRIARATLRLDQTGEGIYIGPNLSRMVPIPFRTPVDLIDTALPLFDGDTPEQSIPAGNTTRRTLAIEHRTPLPCTVVGAFLRLEAA